MRLHFWKNWVVIVYTLSVISLFCLMILSYYGYPVMAWTGFGKSLSSTSTSTTTTESPNTEVTVTEQYQSGKTLWDWLQLFLGVTVTALVAYYGGQITRQQNRIALDNQRGTELQDYLDRMTELILKEGLGNPEKTSIEARIIARARTLTALRGLDGNRKGSLLQFLCEADLIPLIDLSLADLEGANLIAANLRGARLRGAYLVKADLYHADLAKADLSNAILIKVVLEEAELEEVNLEAADLREANLKGAYLNKAILQQANLKGADLSPVPEENWRCDGLRGTDLSETNFYEANLTGVNLNGAILYKANLNSADLSNANLSDADLREASLEGITLEGALYSKGTIWPDGFDCEKAGAKKRQYSTSQTCSITKRLTAIFHS